MEQNNVFNQLDLTRPWTDAVNLPALQEASIALLICPENDTGIEQNGGFVGQATDYAFNKGNDAFLTGQLPSGLFGINSQITFGQIQDGASNTFLMGEAASNPNLPATST